MPHIFTLPVATNRTHSTAWDFLPATHKRKKQKLQEEDALEGGGSDEGLFEEERHATSNPEYSAVVTPEERHQRRRAGQPLDQEPPGLHFPHRQDVSPKTALNRRALHDTVKRPTAPQGQSLHMQHVAVLTTIVHQSLLKEDLPRASRALGLLFREDLVSEHAEVRSQGLMGVAAEVLLRHGHPRDLISGLPGVSMSFTHGGFEKAKRLYERLVVRHPYHKSWPNAVNAIDFYLAMFNLWIYVVHSEHTMPPPEGEDIDATHEFSQTVRELEQATQIAKRLDACMASVPYMDEPEFIRLSAMVALWVADLHRKCAAAVKPYGPQASDARSEHDGVLGLQDEGQLVSESEHFLEASRASAKAQELLSKLEDQGEGDTGGDSADSDSDGDAHERRSEAI